MSEIAVIPIERLDLRHVQRRWAFADERRADIDAHFARLQQAKPALWNGRVLLLHRWSLAEAGFAGEFFETDYASLLAWRDWQFPDPGIRLSFPMGALFAADGGVLVGRMAAHTANAGQVYFPCGTPDRNDLRDGLVDFEAGVMRELTEETGLTSADVIAEPHWHVMAVGPRLAFVKTLRSSQPAAALRAKILAYLGGLRDPELADILFMRGPSDFVTQMPPYVTAFLLDAWRRRR